MVPLNFVASEDAMRSLVDLPADTLVGVLAVDSRSRRRLEAIVQQYSAAAVLGALLDDLEAAANLVEAAQPGPDHQRRQAAPATSPPGPSAWSRWGGPGARRPHRLADERRAVTGSG